MKSVALGSNTRLARRTAAVLAAAALIGVSAGCASNAEGDRTETDAVEEVTTFDFGFAPLAALGSLVASENEGVFASHGLKMDLTILNSTPEGIAAVVGGDLDISTVNPVNLVQALDKNIPIVVLGTHYYSSPEEQGIYVAPDSPIQGPEDWEGVRFGVIGLNNITHLSALKMAKEAGVDPESIEFVQVPAPNMTEMLLQGQIDVVGLSEPLITISGDKVRRLDSIGDPYTVADGESGVLAYFFTSRQYAENNPEVLEAFGAARKDGVRLFAENPDVIRTAIAEFTEIQPVILEQMALPDFRADEGRESFEYWARVAYEFGLISSLPDTDEVFEFALETD